MKIEYFGHSCFKLYSVDGTLVIDPYKDGSVDGLAPLHVEADEVICTHEHADHFGMECVTLSGEDCHIEITPIASWHDDQQGKLRGPNTIYLIETEGYRLAHLGDLGCALNEEQKQLLQNLDVLMIPVGGYFTIDAKQAKEIVDELKPKHTIPMHYRGDNFGYEVLAPVEDFLALVPHHERTDRVIFVDEQGETDVLVPAF